jgi:Dyp-type peroxidase family
MATPAELVEVNDIQGVILDAYRTLPWSSFLLLELSGRAEAKAWLRKVAPAVSESTARPKDPPRAAVHVAFTRAGLTCLGLPDSSMVQFSRPFVEGMCTDERRQALSDDGDSDARQWQWGGPHTRAVHAVLMLYGASRADRDRLESAYLPPQNGTSPDPLVYRLDTCVPGDPKLLFKEHFGFTDGIGQPRVAGVARAVPRRAAVPGRGGMENSLPAGEFLLGYGNQLRAVSPAGPRVIEAGGVEFDLGRNGSYLVLRQLHQDVFGFWKFLDGEGPRAELVKRAAQMVGRWPNGAPLVKAPDRDTQALPDDNEFGFRDGAGQLVRVCPLGAHIRRTNPRDSLESVGSNSTIVANQHRLMRRSRPYGPPLATSMEPIDYLEKQNGDPKAERGLVFAAFNADIERQFEFVQGVWINGQHFTSSQKGEVDPMAGAQPAGGGLFTVQGNPLRRRFGVTNPLPRFVTVRGGAYFFMPGLRALRYLAS